jgi:hypothetical protein
MANMVNVKMKDANMKFGIDETTTVKDLLQLVAKKHRLR